MLKCGSLDGAQYHASDLVIAWETALFVFVQTSSAHCFGKHLGGMPVSSMSKSSGKKKLVATFLALSIQNVVRIVQALARQRRRAVGNDPALRG